jgi:teichuronic acid biosynthesis glycosyltransferase TuaH
LVGPVDQRCEQNSRFRELVARPNVRFVGRVPADEVPSYLAAIDVGITPYRDTSFNRASFPLKTLEYLAAGIPTVSADLPAARWLHADLLKQQPDTPAEDVLALARSNDEYLSAVSHMVAVQRCRERDAIASMRHSGAWDKTNSCIEFASRHSWPLRAEMFASAIGLLPQ